MKRKLSDKVYISKECFNALFVAWCKENRYTFSVGEMELAKLIEENGGDITCSSAIHHYRFFDSEIGRFNYAALQQIFCDTSGLIISKEK